MQLFAHDSWDFTKDLIDTYGAVSKVHSFFGVRRPIGCTLPIPLTDCDGRQGCYMSTTPRHCTRSLSKIKTYMFGMMRV